MLNRTSLGLKSLAVNLGLSHLKCSWGVTCVRPGVWHRKCSWSAISVKWDCALKNMFWRLPYTGTVLTTSGATSLRKPGDSSQYVSKRNWHLYIFHTIFLSIHGLKIITAFLNTHRNVSVLFPKKCHLMHYLILFGSHDIKVFCKPCAKI